MNPYLTVTVQGEMGYEQALVGLSFNKKQEQRMDTVAYKLSSMDGGHNKFLESIQVWLNVRAPRYWWQEADTFRLSTKQSESTMHTLNNELARLNAIEKQADRDAAIFKYIENNFEEDSICLEQMEWILEDGPLSVIKRRLPEGFLQRRMWCMNYKCLRNIILQRRTHRLPHWHIFIREVLNQVEHPELLPAYPVAGTPE